MGANSHPRGELWRAILPVAVWLALILIPAPAGLSGDAWIYFGLIAAVILGLIPELLPAAAIGLIGVALAGALRLVADIPGASIGWALGGFSDRTVWLIFGAYVFSIGYNRTGLARRIALHLVLSLATTRSALIPSIRPDRSCARSAEDRALQRHRTPNG